VPIIGRNDLIAAKRATEREKDLVDAEALVAQRRDSENPIEAC